MKEKRKLILIACIYLFNLTLAGILQALQLVNFSVPCVIFLVTIPLHIYLTLQISGTDDELKNGANWELVNDGAADNKSYINHKAIPIARIISLG